MKADAKTEAAVMETLDKFAIGCAGQDLRGVLALFAPEPDVVGFGTGADEKRIGPAEIKAQFERDFDQCESIRLELKWRSISAAGPVALVAADYTLHAAIEGQEMAMPLRLTAVLKQYADKWLIVQYHNSLPAAGQAKGESFPTDALFAEPDII